MSNQVLIVGAGPSGLFAASELIRHGVDVRLVEREMQPHHEARATTIQAGTLEILDSVGLLTPFLQAAEHVRRACIFASDMTELRVATFDGLDCRYDFECVLPQYETQRILEEHLVALGGAVERGVTATKLGPDGGGVAVDLLHADGKVETIEPAMVIGAGGAHSITRVSMSEHLEGATYQGHFLVADIAMKSPLPPCEAGVVCGPAGLLLLAPMPGGRWITFQDLEEETQTITPEEIVKRIETRLGGRFRPTDVAWFSLFRMHRRMVSRMTDGRRFLIGDAAHLSSAFGGEGLNSGLHDGHDLAWKLALVLHGRAAQSLLQHYAVERTIADRHVLDVSDQVHSGIVGIADYQDGRAGAASGAAAEPHPGQRYPDWTHFGGTSHHLLVFGPIADADGLSRLGQCWSTSVEISRDPNVKPARAGVPAGGMVLIRPDGHIGFRSPSADAAALAALDRHLSSYLIQ